MILAFRKDPAASGCGLCDIDAFSWIGKNLKSRYDEIIPTCIYSVYFRCATTYQFLDTWLTNSEKYSIDIYEMSKTWNTS